MRAVLEGRPVADELPSVARLIVAARQSHHWTQWELAKAIDSRDHYVYRWERAHHVPSTQKAVRLARALDIPIDVMLDALDGWSAAVEAYIRGLRAGQEPPHEPGE